MTAPATTDETFATDVLASDLPVLVDFTAEWCGPCRIVDPIVSQIAVDNTDKLRVVTLDVDRNPQTTHAYRVLGMPTLALFVRGEIVARILGARSKQAILKEFAPYL